MKRADRLALLAELGKTWRTDPELEPALQKAEQQNPFFTRDFQLHALSAIGNWLSPQILENWLEDCPEPGRPRRIGLLLAGNIPLVGWHDLMSVFASGHLPVYRPSSSDKVLTGFMVSLLSRLDPAAGRLFEEADNLRSIDALIATGSRATATQFDYYFRHIPRLIRGSRSSMAVLYGFETKAELEPLADDIMLYFGMGCRSVTKLLVPREYDFSPFFEALEKYRHLTLHHRYQNNGIYHKAIFLMNGDRFLENDLLIVREEKSLFSPVSVLNYQTYSHLDEARETVAGHQRDLQVLVSHQGQFPGSLPFGSSQSPGLTDYADGVDTLAFIRSVSEGKA